MKAKRFCQCGTELERSRTKDGRAARWPKYCSPECQAEAYKINQPTAVYILANALGEPIYVGVSGNLKQRMIAHKATKDWWESVANIDFEDFTNRLEAEVREAELIKTLKPLHNRAIPIDPTSTPDATDGMNRVLVVFSDGLLSELDSARGLVSRSAWIRQAVEDKLMKQAVAPLVPIPAIWTGPLPNGGMLDADYEVDLGEPKPRARRKNKIENVKGSGGSNPLSGATKRGDGTPQSALTPAESPSALLTDVEEWAEECREDPEIQARTAATISRIRSGNYEKVPIADHFKRPQRCNRGACTGTINPVSGRCLHCNQTPLKETK